MLPHLAKVLRHIWFGSRSCAESPDPKSNLGRDVWFASHDRHVRCGTIPHDVFACKHSSDGDTALRQPNTKKSLLSKVISLKTSDDFVSVWTKDIPYSIKFVKKDTATLSDTVYHCSLILHQSTKECNYGMRASQTSLTLTKFIANINIYVFN